MFAVIQTRVTALDGGRPVPETVSAAPAGATSGFVVRVFIGSAGLPASTTAPGRAGVPGITGAVTGIGSAKAADCASSSTPRSGHERDEEPSAEEPDRGVWRSCQFSLSRVTERS